VELETFAKSLDVTGHVTIFMPRGISVWGHQVVELDPRSRIKGGTPKNFHPQEHLLYYSLYIFVCLESIFMFF
jgi:hypothetical protein